MNDKKGEKNMLRKEKSVKREEYKYAKKISFMEKNILKASGKTQRGSLLAIVTTF